MDALKHTSLSLDSVKHTKVESSLASPDDITKRAVSTIIHEDGLSGKLQDDTRWQNETDDNIHELTGRSTQDKTRQYQACG